MKQKITPCLWFDDQAEEAMRFYVSVFENSKVGRVTQYGAAGAAVSFIVNCDTQDEIDTSWEKLSEGGEQGICGRLNDTFGLSCQIVPIVLSDMMQDRDADKTNRVMEAIPQMKKLDFARFQEAYGRSQA